MWKFIFWQGCLGFKKQSEKKQGTLQRAILFDDIGFMLISVGWFKAEGQADEALPI